MTLGLLEWGASDPGALVPVLLSVGSWDPVQHSLDNWIVRTLAADYYAGREATARALLNRRQLLPILDGLDEIPESARRTAVLEINKAIGRDRPIVVTCRTAEYRDVIDGGSPVLRRAPVVEMTPVAPDDVVGYLSAVDWPAGVDWSAVYEHLRNQPNSPLSAALRTPLMASLARAIYQRGGADPAR